MVDAYLNCPSTAIFPTLYGVAESTELYAINSCETKINSMDAYGTFVVAGGQFECDTNPYAIFPDLEFAWCY